MVVFVTSIAFGQGSTVPGHTSSPVTNADVTVPACPHSADSAPGPTLFTALEEQLGLRLESAKGPVSVLVIDHIEKPTEN